MFSPLPPNMRQAALMFDLETLGTPDTHPAPNGVVILSIGAVIFDAYKPLQTATELKEHTFYANICTQSCLDLGMVIDETTQIWWAGQTWEAWNQTQINPRPFVEVAADFKYWVESFPLLISEYWANSPSFDKELLARSMNAARVGWPHARLPFYREADVRTLKRKLWPEGDAPKMNEGTLHNALDDAIAQARLVQIMHDKLGLVHHENYRD